MDDPALLAFFELSELSSLEPSDMFRILLEKRLEIVDPNTSENVFLSYSPPYAFQFEFFV